MSSTPAASIADVSFTSESTLPRITSSLASMRWMVGTDSPDSSASLRWSMPSKARAARNCAEVITRVLPLRGGRTLHSAMLHLDIYVLDISPREALSTPEEDCYGVLSTLGLNGLALLERSVFRNALYVFVVSTSCSLLLVALAVSHEAADTPCSELVRVLDSALAGFGGTPETQSE
jgi:hypothetical protein